MTIFPIVEVNKLYSSGNNSELEIIEVNKGKKLFIKFVNKFTFSFNVFKIEFITFTITFTDIVDKFESIN